MLALNLPARRFIAEIAHHTRHLLDSLRRQLIHQSCGRSVATLGGRAHQSPTEVNANPVRVADTKAALGARFAAPGCHELLVSDSAEEPWPLSISCRFGYHAQGHSDREAAVAP